MKVIIVERNSAVLYAFNQYMVALFPKIEIIVARSIASGMELLTNHQDAGFVFWADEVNGGLTTEGLFQYGVQTLPKAKHIAMGTASEMKRACAITLPRSFTDSDLRSVFPGLLRQSKKKDPLVAVQ